MKKEILGVKPDQVHKILKKHMLADGMPVVFDFENSHGCHLYDALSGKKYLDCFGQYASLPLGYNHPKILDKMGHFLDPSITKVVNSDIYTQHMAAFVDTFSKILPKQFTKTFFIEGGSAAVENCLKIAFDWFAQTRNLNDKEAQKLDVIHLKECFHGRGGYTLSLTNSSFDKISYFPRFNWTTVTNPKIHFPMKAHKVKHLEDISLKEIEDAMKKGNVAAFIMEPIQGEGGNNMFRKEYFQSVRKLCDKYNCLLIFDEVQTGFGSTGKWWAWEHYDVVPDMFAFGKKSQVCGVAANMDNIGKAKDNCFSKSSRINSTWGGNIIDMVRCKFIIDVILEDKTILSQVSEVGNYLLGKLNNLAKGTLFKASKISNVRGIGTIVAFDMPTKEERNAMLTKLNKNMIILGCGEKSIRFRPPLTFSKENVNEAMGYIKNAL